jgi:thymidylate kinase
MVYGRGFDYWEAGMDLHCADNLYDSFCIYQSELVRQFDQMADEFGFVTLDANRPASATFEDLRTQIRELIKDDR